MAEAIAAALGTTAAGGTAAGTAAGTAGAAGATAAGTAGTLGATGAVGAGTAGTLGAAGTAGTGIGAAGLAGDAATGLSALAGEGATVSGATPLAGEAATMSLTPEALTASNGLSILEGTGLPATEGGLGTVATPAAQASPSLLGEVTPAANLAATQSELYAPQLSSSLTSGLGPMESPNFATQLSAHLDKYGTLYGTGVQGGEELYKKLTAGSNLPQMTLPNIPQTPQVPYPQGGGDKFAWMRAFGVQG